MFRLAKGLRGDKAIWGIIALLALFSFLPVYSATAEQVFNKGSSFGYLMIKQSLLWILGFAIMFVVHRVPTHYFKGLSLIAMPIVLLLLAYTLTVETTIGAASANRWIRIPVIGMNFQTSTLASVVLMVWIARYLTKVRDKDISFNESFVPLWLPIILVVGLILPANFSTAALVGFLALLLCFLGGYPIRHLARILISGIAVAGMFLFVLFTNPDVIPSSRAVTWKNRIENYWNGEQNQTDGQILTQLDKAKMAIAEGGLLGKGAGKSVMKNILPESDSDFIFAIVVEEYGLAGGFALLFFYLLLLFRIVVVANSAKSIFSKLVVIGVGLPIVFQALFHMAVSVGLLPTTGQPLPLISRGGTSIWMTCLAIGIILSASDKKQHEERKTATIDESNPLEVLSGQL
ncbi:FtsW/RodA/SpoVE family cell cycle protein [Croceivirga thetidis]|uniref:Probable peptidoglycan glycosyltransferase FtsW n=1 Tax=Croceivirga thetidis TaxID=2721623 RepID=A0ABX1GKK2_9FLAO|nr:FtsW/RodA/SpoVE family cell cycle protein [Croceivirga thetidis]NKI30403.1 FtsW/RodA/SpoVE family cell cycle protein [Croceivirga thetidis]